MPLLVREQLTSEWKAAHRGRLTASIAAACLGQSPWTSRQKAWRTILGTEPERSNPYMDWGNRSETTARANYETATGDFVVQTGFWVHPELDWLGASPDGFVGTEGMVELKCPNELPESIPPHYEIQMRVQMAATERAWCDFFAWTPAGSYLSRIERDAGIESDLIARLDVFYREFVVANIEPPRKTKPPDTGLQLWVDWLAAIGSNLAAFNAGLPDLAELSGPAKQQAWGIVSKHAQANGWSFNKSAKVFEQNSEVTA